MRLRAITTLLCTTLVTCNLAYADSSREKRHEPSHETKQQEHRRTTDSHRNNSHRNNSHRKTEQQHTQSQHRPDQHRRDNHSQHRPKKVERYTQPRNNHQHKPFYSANKMPRKKNHHHKYFHDSNLRNHKHSHHNGDAAIFLGGALLGAAIVDNLVDDTHTYGAVRHNRIVYHYEYDRRGDCYRVEHRSPNKKVMVAAPYHYCEASYY